MESSNRVNRIILTIYLSFILISQIIAVPNINLPFLIIESLALIVIALLVSPVVIKYFSRFNVHEDQHFCKISARTLKFIFYGVPFFVLLLYYFAYYPGGFTNDSLAQFNEYFYSQYEDWHPALHTLFTFTLPLKLTHGWIGSVILFQIILFAAALGYGFDSIYKYAGRNYVLGSMIYILFNPLLCICVNPWKDTSFAIGALLLMTYALRIYVTKGDWFKKPLNMVLFLVVFVFTTIFRHNAILFTAPLLLALLFYISRKRTLCLILAVVALFAVIKGPLYSAVGVQKESQRRQIETMGLPLTVIGAAVTYTPEVLDEDILEFAYKIAPEQIWEDYYEMGNINIIKWGTVDNIDDMVDIDVVDEYESSEIIDMMLRCFKASPYVSLRSLVKLTEGVYTVTDSHYVEIVPYIDDNYFGIGVPGIGIDNYLGLNKPSTRSNIITTAFYYHWIMIKVLFPHVFLFYGVALLLVVISFCSKLRLGKLKDWKKVLFAVPLLAYNFGTALLLTGSNDCPRYFYYTVLVVPVLLVFFYRKEEKSR